MNLHARKIVYFGLPGVFSTIPFRALIEAQANIEAVVFPRPGKDQRGLFLLPTFDVPKIELPLITMPVTDNLQVEASRFGIPIFSVGDLNNPAALKGLSNFEADIFIIACFPHIFPPELLSIPKEGCINLHPSLLPAYRGPEPLFWQFYYQEPRKGLSIHFMDAGIDSGDIIAQREIVYPDDLFSFNELDKFAAEASAELLLHALTQETIPRTPQLKTSASYYSIPTFQDLIAPETWSPAQLDRMKLLFPHFGQFIRN